MTILYRGPRGLVTHDVIATVHVGWRRLPIKDLQGIHIVRVRLAGGRRLMSVSALFVALLVIPLTGWPVAILPVVVLIATAAGLAVGGQPDRWNLTADHLGVRTVLFTSTDQREFDQLCRGLRRAVEHLTDAR
jgi:hypothetical protein